MMYIVSISISFIDVPDEASSMSIFISYSYLFPLILSRRGIRDELKAQLEAAGLEKAQREAERAAAKDGTANGGEENANN